MWQLYDRLIRQVPEDIIVDHIHVGETWTIVHAGSYCGIAVTVNEQAAALPKGKLLLGKSLQSVASLCKSWDFPLASIGTAALNAFHNHPDRVFSLPNAQETENAFTDYARATQGKNVAVIGHFRSLEHHLTEAKNLSILERLPKENDYPDSACEFLLPEQDYVFITGSAFINKTLPRLLQLSSQGTAIVLGPSTPLSPILLEYGADELSGLTLHALAPHQTQTVGQGNVMLSEYGTRVCLRTKD